MKSQKQATKEVNVIYTYKFNKINRICFTVLSSNEQDQYNTCFDGSAEKASCTCPGGASVRHHCYHMDQLMARAADYFASRQPVQPKESDTVAILVPEGIQIIDKSELTSTDIIAEPVKANPVAEAEAFIAKVQAEKAQKVPAPRQQEDWSTPNGSLYRETRNYEIVNGRACPMR